MTYKVGPKGQVVVPKRIRDRLGIHPGDEVLVEEDGDGVKIRKTDRAATVASLYGILRGETSLTAALEAERRAERELEERKIRRWTEGHGE